MLRNKFLSFALAIFVSLPAFAAVPNAAFVATYGGLPSQTGLNSLYCPVNLLSQCKKLTVGYSTTVTSANTYAFFDGDVKYQAPPYVFTVTSASATNGATYTNNGVTFTVEGTISGATTLKMGVGTADHGLPTTSGTLTKASGTGDATITFSAAVYGKFFYITGWTYLSNGTSTTGNIMWVWATSSFANNAALGAASADVHYYTSDIATFEGSQFITPAAGTSSYFPYAGDNFPPGRYLGIRPNTNGTLYMNIYGVEISADK